MMPIVSRANSFILITVNNFLVDKKESSAYTINRNSNVSGVRAPQKVVLDTGQGKRPYLQDALTGRRGRQRAVKAVVLAEDLMISAPLRRFNWASRLTTSRKLSH